MLQSDFILNNGNKIPSIGLGTWNSKKDEVGEAVRFAIEEARYKHIDCASVYGNEKEIGESFKNIFSGDIKRENIFITSKLWNTDHNPEHVIEACKKSLSNLHLDYLDLYLVHWAIAFQHGEEIEPLDKDGWVITEPVSIRETWEAMEELVKMGLVKSIGISNFNAQSVADLLTYAKIRPSVNQIELHPYNTQDKLIDYMKHEDIHVTAYSPLGTPVNLKETDPYLMEDSLIKKLSEEYNATPAQILINWGINRGTSVIPKSIKAERIKSNLEALNIEISEEDHKMISNLNRGYRFVDAYDWWKIPYFN